MAKRKTQKSEAQIQYEKQLKRIKQFIRRAEKRGYTFSATAIPQKVKRPTKRSVEKLMRITPETLYRKASYTEPMTGQVFRGVEGRKVERKAAAKKGAATRQFRSQQFEANVSQIREAERNRALDVINTLKATATERGYLMPKEYLKSVEDYIKGLGLTAKDYLVYQSITEESILSSEGVIFKDPRTKTAFKGHEGLKIEAHRAEIGELHKLNYSTNASETYRVLELVREYINTWSPSSLWTDWFAETKEKDKNQLERQLNGAILSEGVEVVTQRMQEHADEILEIVQSVLYGSGGKEGQLGINFDLVRFSTIILGRPLTQQESEELTSTSESNEVT